jgi:hypothetical protein
MSEFDEIEACNAAKCGEYNMLRCCSPKGHTGDHCYVVDHENDYPHRKAERAKKARRSAES